jgi:hypothetical protein
MTRPIRIQRKRTKGWRMPENTVYVGRGSKWGNTYRIGDDDPLTCSPMTASHVVFWFRADLDPLISMHATLYRSAIKSELRGKNLACWCPLDQPCHADVLLEIANA